MDSHEDGKVNVDLLNDEEKRLLRLYGKLPSAEGLLRVKERKYFDSGDLALQQASKTSNTGIPIQTGKDHPLLKNLSHLSSPVPGNSNVAKDADSSHQGSSSDYHDTRGGHLNEEEHVET